MSGGVDSSVAAALLLKAGHDVTGAFMVNYDDKNTEKSCWRRDYQDALRVCARLGIKLLRLDFQDEYKKHVSNYMYKEYEAGRTPNPDVLCNKYIKFGVWLEKARELGFDLVATGHYANTTLSFPRPPSPRLWRLKRRESMVKLLAAKDSNIDQTYFLHQLNQDQLQHVIFPIGKYIKDEVRKLAKKFKLPTAEKEESLGICFIGEVPMKEFLEKKIKAKKGKIITSEGKMVGEHSGLPFYTIGQRVGLVSLRAKRSNPNADSTRPLFVVGKNIAKNELIVGNEDDPLLYSDEIEVTDVNWINGQPPKLPLKCLVRLRHRQPLQECIVCHCENPDPVGRRGNLIVKFTIPQRAVTPGQFAVFYATAEALAKEDRECLGGGVIN